MLILIAALASAIPVMIWLSVFFRKNEKSKKTIAFIFLLGCLTAPALLGLQHLWSIFPNFDLGNLIENGVQNQILKYIFTFILFASMEELIKLYVIKAVDERTLLIQTVNDSVRYAIVSALGFSFIENAFYLYQFWPQLNLGALAGLFIFRAIFTTCAHMIFSGIFGYYYGIGKYSIVMTHHEKLANGISKTTKLISKIFHLPLSEGFRQKTVLKGLIIAISAHSTFNFLLQMNKTLPVIIFAILGYLYLRLLLSRKSGHLVLTEDITTKAVSTIPKKDKEVVIELLGMWFQEKRFVDVIHICERLLERDPDNRVVKLFQARASDEISGNSSYKKILTNMFRDAKEMNQYDRNIITKYTTEKEEFEKAKKKIKELIEKEGRTFIEPESQKPTPPQQNSENKTYKL